jgi:histidine ammonia-lyase
MTNPLSLSGAGLTPTSLARIAQAAAPVALASDGLARLREGRAVVERAIAQNRPVYGLTRGLGDQVGDSLPAAMLADFSRRTIRGRAMAVGPALPRTVVRGAMAVRLNGALTGRTGMSEAAARTILDALNAGLTPVVPRVGSIGEADLCVMASLALALIGDPEGRAEIDGDILPADQALTRAGLTPLVPGPKDGLALISNNSIAIAEAALAFEAIERAVEAETVATALMLEAFRANPSPLDPACAEARPQPGQADAARRLRDLLAGGDLMEDPAAPRRLQDPLSLRCAAPSLGAATAALDAARAAIDAELNGAGDNPMVDVAGDRLIPTPNFHAPGLALACDHLAAAVATLGAGALARCQILGRADFTDLPRLLSPGGVGSAGVAPLYKVGQALMHRLIRAAQPAAAVSSMAGGSLEDSMSFAPQAAEKLQECADAFRLLTALELRIAMQALQLRGVARPGTALAPWIERLTPLCPPLDAEDRPLGREVEAIADALLPVA